MASLFTKEEKQMKYLKNAAVAAVAFTLAVGLSFSSAEAARIKTSVASAGPGAAA